MSNTIPLPEPDMKVVIGDQAIKICSVRAIKTYAAAVTAAKDAEIAGLREDAVSLRAERDNARADRDALRAEVARLKQLVCDAAYTLEGARIWGGMDWTYNPLHPFKYRPMLDRLNVERDKINDKRAAARKGDA